MSVFLTCNAGSSNVKLAAFDVSTMERVGHAVIRQHPDAVTEWLCAIGSRGIQAVGHRIVHGGLELTHPTELTSTVIEKIKALIPLAPLHQPAAIEWVEVVRGLYPGVPQIACFDTAFHHTLPAMERMLPLPETWRREGIQRYGFHGLSYQHIAAVLPQIATEGRAHGRIIAAHLGSGSSACSMHGLQSVATTMGFSTLDGLMMSTRCGTLDAGVVLHLLTEKKMPPADITRLLYHESGLKGVSGLSGDMHELLESSAPKAKEAVALYCHLAARQIAGLLPSLGGLDALVFTGGIGENATVVREKITNLLRFAGDFPVYVIPADEERVIAEACRVYALNEARK